MLKKSLLGAVVVLGALIVSSSFSSNAHAGYKHHYKYGGYDYGHGYRRGYRYRHRHYRHSDRGAYLLGGIALGALLSHSYHSSYRDPYRHTYHRPHRRYSHHDGYVVREVRRPVVVRTEGVVTRRLHRDRDGNCFERKHSNGEELLIELSPSQCAW